MKLYPIGYTALGSMESLEDLLKDEQTYLIDIRMRAQSRFWPQWNKGALIAKFGDQYIHEPKLGNVNYRQADRQSGYPCADPAAGIARLVDMLSQGKSVILLCACKSYDECHRRKVVELVLAQIPEVEIVLEENLLCQR